MKLVQTSAVRGPRQLKVDQATRCEKGSEAALTLAVRGRRLLARECEVCRRDATATLQLHLTRIDRMTHCQSESKVAKDES